MRELSLFTGAGGGLLGTHLLGWEPIGYVEIDDYCQRVIAARITDGFIPKAPVFGDIRQFVQSGAALEYRGFADVVTGGFPCQDISCAGTGKGLDGERSGLWSAMLAVIRDARPAHVVVENSPMLAGRGLGVVLGNLADLGFDARWGVFSACAIGAPHTRERMFIVAHDRSQRSQARSWIESAPVAQRSLGHRSAVKYSVRGRPRECGWWSSEPKLDRVAHGLADRMDRVRAIGNGQVPDVVAAAWEILK